MKFSQKESFKILSNACCVQHFNTYKGVHGTQHLVFLLSHFSATIFQIDNFLVKFLPCFGGKKNQLGCVLPLAKNRGSFDAM